MDRNFTTRNNDLIKEVDSVES